LVGEPSSSVQSTGVITIAAFTIAAVVAGPFLSWGSRVVALRLVVGGILVVVPWPVAMVARLGVVALVGRVIAARVPIFTRAVIGVTVSVCPRFVIVWPSIVPAACWRIILLFGTLQFLVVSLRSLWGFVVSPVIVVRSTVLILTLVVSAHGVCVALVVIAPSAHGVVTLPLGTLMTIVATTSISIIGVVITRRLALVSPAVRVVVRVAALAPAMPLIRPIIMVVPTRAWTLCIIILTSAFGIWRVSWWTLALVFFPKVPLRATSVARTATRIRPMTILTRPLYV
jgi:hypothetical protein